MIDILIIIGIGFGVYVTVGTAVALALGRFFKNTRRGVIENLEGAPAKVAPIRRRHRFIRGDENPT